MHRYFLGLKELDESIGGVEGGASILLIGPPMCGKEILMNAILSAGISSGESVILAENRIPAHTVLHSISPTDTARIGVIDCITRSLGYNVTDTQAIRYASGPVDLTGVSVRISQLAEEFSRKDMRDIRFCIDSLSTVLMYSDLETVFRFMHLFTGRVHMSKTLGLCMVDEDMHDTRTIATLKQLFKGMIEVKSQDGRNFFRAVGLTPRPTPWFEYEIDGGAVTIVGAVND